MSDMKIFSGNSNPELTQGICDNLNIPIGKIKLKSFPSGEEYCQFDENIRGKDVYIVQALSYPVNDNLMQMLLMSDAARRASASRITAVIPYFGYSRQDRKDRPRVPISARLVMDLIKVSGIDRILTMDLHAPQIGGFTNLPMDHLYFKPALSSVIKSLNLDCVVAPDIGSVKRADEYATALKTDLVIISKRRTSDKDVEVKHFIGDVKGKRVIIIDDLTESAGTLIEASLACRAEGAKEVYCAITHGCFTDVGVNRLNDAFEHDVIDKLYVSNTVKFNVPNSLVDNIEVVDVAGLFATAIKNTHNNESISSLFV